MLGPMFGPPPCDRKMALAEKDRHREEMEAWKECKRINKRPGYQTLTKMRFNRGS